MNANPRRAVLDTAPPPEPQSGSALLIAMFVLVLLTAMGSALLFLSRHEARMSQASLRAKKAFFLAEAGVEDARTALFQANGTGPFADDLLAAAGANGVIDFDPATVAATYSGDDVTGFTGTGDDVALRAVQALGGPGNPGWYTAYLTNDPLDGPSNLVDSNDRVMVTGVGAGPQRSYEVVQAILEPFRFIPGVPAAALTMLGPDPHYDNGSSSAQEHSGDDCGVAGGPFAPVVGAIGSDASQDVKDGMHRPEDFEAGSWDGEDTIGDLTNPADPIVADAGHGTIDDIWTDCEKLKKLVDFLELASDYYCNADLHPCSFPVAAPDNVIFVDGDLTNTPPGPNQGILVVTGVLDYKGNTEWDGAVLVIGEGKMLRSGGGNGKPSGAVVVANIDPTPNGPSNDRSDWCTNPPDGFGSAWYETGGGGNSETQWCTAKLDAANSIRSYRVTEFVQR